MTLREARKQAGIKQESVAGDLGVDNDTISRWETGKREISAYNLSRLATSYRVTGDVFLSPPERIDEVESAVRRSRQLYLAIAEAAEQRQRDDEGGSTPPGRSQP